jgi:hypothetical protein
MESQEQRKTFARHGLLIIPPRAAVPAPVRVPLRRPSEPFSRRRFLRMIRSVPPLR